MLNPNKLSKHTCRQNRDFFSQKLPKRPTPNGGLFLIFETVPIAIGIIRKKSLVNSNILLLC